MSSNSIQIQASQPSLLSSDERIFLETLDKCLTDAKSSKGIFNFATIVRNYTTDKEGCLKKRGTFGRFRQKCYGLLRRLNKGTDSGELCAMSFEQITEYVKKHPNIKPLLKEKIAAITLPIKGQKSWKPKSFDHLQTSYNELQVACAVETEMANMAASSSTTLVITDLPELSDYLNSRSDLNTDLTKGAQGRENEIYTIKYQETVTSFELNCFSTTSLLLTDRKPGGAQKKYTSEGALIDALKRQFPESEPEASTAPIIQEEAAPPPDNSPKYLGNENVSPELRPEIANKRDGKTAIPERSKAYFDLLSPKLESIGQIHDLANTLSQLFSDDMQGADHTWHWEIESFYEEGESIDLPILKLVDPSSEPKKDLGTIEIRADGKLVWITFGKAELKEEEKVWLPSREASAPQIVSFDALKRDLRAIHHHLSSHRPSETKPPSTKIGKRRRRAKKRPQIAKKNLLDRQKKIVENAVVAPSNTESADLLRTLEKAQKSRYLTQASKTYPQLQAYSEADCEKSPALAGIFTIKDTPNSDSGICEIQADGQVRWEARGGEIQTFSDWTLFENVLSLPPPAIAYFQQIYAKMSKTGADTSLTSMMPLIASLKTLFSPSFQAAQGAWKLEVLQAPILQVKDVSTGTAIASCEILKDGKVRWTAYGKTFDTNELYRDESLAIQSRKRKVWVATGQVEGEPRELPLSGADSLEFQLSLIAHSTLNSNPELRRMRGAVNDSSVGLRNRLNTADRFLGILKASGSSKPAQAAELETLAQTLQGLSKSPFLGNQIIARHYLNKPEEAGKFDVYNEDKAPLGVCELLPNGSVKWSADGDSPCQLFDDWKAFETDLPGLLT